MRFERLRDEVMMAERRLETRHLRAQTNWRVLKTIWRESWTPGRIVAIGLAGGFLFGRARPLKKMGAVSPTRWIQLASAVSGLLATLKAKEAAETAEVAAADAGHAADAADEAADNVEAVAGAAAPTPGDASPRTVSDGRRRADTQWSSEPRPAEAATELSER
ncbi:protein sip-5 [Luteimonas saliphila]|uniref:protein sip-5 n=1 Tax=Luteimonas saliphila TaxID=2804919 RepID=UPI00192DEBEB|nr:protein sip-5 [Luteimonas saliphila]